MSRGKVIEIRGPIGFIETLGNPKLFFHKSALPSGGVRVGDEIDFDESIGPKGPRAENIRIAQPGNPVPSATPAIAVPTATAVTPARARTEDGLAVSWRYDDPVVQSNLILVRIWIMFLHLGKSVSGHVVNLFKVSDDGTRTKVITPSAKAATDGKGEAYFALYLPPDVEHCDLVAIAGGKEYPYTWIKTRLAQTAPITGQVPATPAASTGATKPSTIEVEKFAPDANGVYTFRVIAIPNKDVTIGGNVVVKARLVGQTTWSQGPFTADDQGRTNLEIMVRDKGAKGEIDFRAEDLQSKSRYVTSKQ